MEATRIGALDIAVISNTAPGAYLRCALPRRREWPKKRVKTREPGYKLTNDSLSPHRRVQSKESIGGVSDNLRMDYMK